MCALAVRFNTTVSASDARLANMSYASKISQERLLRSQERSKWYQLSEAERTEILFPAPRKIQFDYYDAGHMMYLKESDGAKLSNDVRGFIQAGQ